MSEPIPINAPPRAELWRRNQLALAILGHRPLVPIDTRNLLISVLRGDEVAVPKEAS